MKMKNIHVLVLLPKTVQEFVFNENYIHKTMYNQLIYSLHITVKVSKDFICKINC